MLVANLARFFCQSPEPFGVIPSRFGRNEVGFGGPRGLA
jgi:hypothetical protein